MDKSGFSNFDRDASGISESLQNDDLGNSAEPYNEVYVWGADAFGQLGLCGQFQQTTLETPKACSFNVVIKSLACGENHTIFVSDGGHCYAMGDNRAGQLGLGDRAV